MRGLKLTVGSSARRGGPGANEVNPDEGIETFLMRAMPRSRARANEVNPDEGIETCTV